MQNQGFKAHEKGQSFNYFLIFRKIDWLCRADQTIDHFTDSNSQGISGTIIYISFIWHPDFENCASGKAAVTSGKSGLMCSTLKMLISVLSNRAVLANLERIFCLAMLCSTTIDVVKSILNLWIKIKLSWPRVFILKASQD